MFSLNSRVSLAPNLHYASIGDKHLFLNPTIPDWIVVNTNGAWVIAQVNIHKNIRDILTSAESVGASKEEVLSVLEEAHNSFILQNGLGNVDNQSCASENSIDKTDVISYPLRTIHLKLTNKCNLKCSYCYAESGRNKGALTWDELIRLCENISTISPKVDYVLSGGEPLLHPNALDYGEYVKARGNSVHLLTNGYFVNQRNAVRIASIASLIKISIDGSTAAIHGHTRGSHSFMPAVRAAKLLLDKGANVRIAMVVHRQNMHDVQEMVKQWGSLVSFQPLFKAGRGQDLDKLSITGEEYYKALSSVEGVAPFGALTETLMKARKRGIRKCAMADAEVSISNTGDVYPCQMLENDEFLAGNIREQSFCEIYSGSPILRMLSKTTVSEIEGCATCPIRLLCAGGCRARSYYETGDINKAGEFCEYEKRAFIHGIIENTKFYESSI